MKGLWRLLRRQHEHDFIPVSFIPDDQHGFIVLEGCTVLNCPFWRVRPQ